MQHSDKHSNKRLMCVTLRADCLWITELVQILIVTAAKFWAQGEHQRGWTQQAQQGQSAWRWSVPDLLLAPCHRFWDPPATRAEELSLCFVPKRRVAWWGRSTQRNRGRQMRPERSGRFWMQLLLCPWTAVRLNQVRDPTDVVYRRRGPMRGKSLWCEFH
jgi:hypothetical protein